MPGNSLPLACQTGLDKKYQICDLWWGNTYIVFITASVPLVQALCYFIIFFLPFSFSNASCNTVVQNIMLICKHWKRSFILFRFTALVRRLELKSGNISSFWFVVPSWRFQRPLGIHKIYWSRLLGHLFRLVYVYLAQLYHEPNALLVVSSLSVHWHHKNSVVIESLTSLLKLKDSCFSTFCALSVLSKKNP